jgi:hypothetical protein
MARCLGPTFLVLGIRFAVCVLFGILLLSFFQLIILCDRLLPGFGAPAALLFPTILAPRFRSTHRSSNMKQPTEPQSPVMDSPLTPGSTSGWNKRRKAQDDGPDSQASGSKKRTRVRSALSSSAVFFHWPKRLNSGTSTATRVGNVIDASRKYVHTTTTHFMFTYNIPLVQPRNALFSCRLPLKFCEP